MAKEALLVIDMLNDFVREGAPLEVPEARKIVPAIKSELDAARSEGRPVIYVCDAHLPEDKEFTKFGWPKHAVRGSEGARIVDELRPQSGDVIVEKTTYSGFFRTRLDDVLRELQVGSLRLTGCVTHICILFTASDAVLRDYRVTVPEHAVAPLAREDHEAALRIMRNVLGVNVI